MELIAYIHVIKVSNLLNNLFVCLGAPSMCICSKGLQLQMCKNYDFLLHGLPKIINCYLPHSYMLISYRFNIYNILCIGNGLYRIFISTFSFFLICKAYMYIYYDFECPILWFRVSHFMILSVPFYDFECPILWFWVHHFMILSVPFYNFECPILWFWVSHFRKQ